MRAYADKLREEGREQEALDLVLSHIASLTHTIRRGQHDGSNGPHQKLVLALILGSELCNRRAEAYLKAKDPHQAAAALSRATELLELLNSLGPHANNLDEVKVRYEHAFNLAEVSRMTGELEESLLWLGECVNLLDGWGTDCCPDKESAHICLAETLLRLDRLEAAEQSSASAILALTEIPDLYRNPTKAYSMCFALSIRRIILARMGWWKESGACVARAKEVAAQVTTECGNLEGKAHRALVNNMERLHGESIEHHRVESACAQGALLAGIVQTELKNLVEGGEKSCFASSSPPEGHCRSPASTSRAAPGRKACHANQAAPRKGVRPKSPLRSSDRCSGSVRPSRRRHYWAMRNVEGDSQVKAYYEDQKGCNSLMSQQWVQELFDQDPCDQNDDVIADFLDSLC